MVAAVACALVGLFLLTGASLDLSFGDGVTLITAFAWALWLIGTGEVTRRFDTFALIFVQVVDDRPRLGRRSPRSRVSAT